MKSIEGSFCLGVIYQVCSNHSYFVNGLLMVPVTCLHVIIEAKGEKPDRKLVGN